MNDRDGSPGHPEPPVRSILDEDPHPYERLAERARGICLLSRLWAQSDDASHGINASAR